MMKVKENRSEKIREYLKSIKPYERSPKAVSEALKAKGTTVSPTLVSLVKMKLNARKAKAMSASRARKAKESAWINDVIRAKHFVISSGGLKEAKKLLEVVSRLI